jgi:hypothetical protein
VMHEKTVQHSRRDLSAVGARADDSGAVKPEDGKSGNSLVKINAYLYRGALAPASCSIER